jgi:hypothetical protein
VEYRLNTNSATLCETGTAKVSHIGEREGKMEVKKVNIVDVLSTQE